MQLESKEIVSTLSGHEERIAALEAYQKEQNGQLRELNRKIDQIFYGIIAILGSIAGGAVLLLLQNGGR